MRRVLRSWKCKASFHQGSPDRKEFVVVDDSGERIENTIHGCGWHGCRCYCHPWFVKKVTIAARKIEHRSDANPKAA